MVDDSGSHSKEILEDMSNDLADEGMRRRSTTACQAKRSPSYKVTLGIVIGILALLLLLLFRGGNGVTQEEVRALSKRLDQIERRLASTEATEKRIASFENQVQTLNQSFSRLDGAARTLREKLDALTQQMEKSGAKNAPAPKTSPPSPSQKSAQSKSISRYHEVKPGETLFQIAGIYHTTVEEVRRLNKLKPEQVLQPGQKLLVPTGR